MDSLSQLETVRSTLLSRKSPIVIDTETNKTDSYDERWLMGISIAQENDSWYIPVGHLPLAGIPQKNIERIPTGFFDDLRHHEIVMHYAFFDLHMLRRFAHLTVDYDHLYDTMLMHHYINENHPHDLEWLSNNYTTVKKNMGISKILNNDWDHALIPGMEIYAREDAEAELQLYEYLKADFELYRESWETVDRAFLYCLLKMEEKGLPVDKQECLNQSKLCRERMAAIKRELGWDCGSTNLLREKLFSEPPKGYGLKLKSVTEKTGKPQINQKFLEETNHPVCGLILEYRKCQKAAGYFEGYLRIAGRSDRLHPSFKMHGTVTGRLSCENPNTQQIPREDKSGVKKIFLPEPGCQLWEVDFKNLEMRMAAVYSQCPALLDIFHNERDLHGEVAQELGINRQVAKIVNFLLTYGGGPPALSVQAGISFSKAKETYNLYRKAYPELFRCMDDAASVAEQKGYVRLFSGRRRHFQYPSEYRKAFNSIVQGGGFEIVKRGMLRLDKLGVDMRNQVHDSVWINTDNPSEIPEIERELSEWTKEDFGLLFSVESKRLR